jgi:hypothetical protein
MRTRIKKSRKNRKSRRIRGGSGNVAAKDKIATLRSIISQLEAVTKEFEDANKESKQESSGSTETQESSNQESAGSTETQ